MLHSATSLPKKSIKERITTQWFHRCIWILRAVSSCPSSWKLTRPQIFLYIWLSFPCSPYNSLLQGRSRSYKASKDITISLSAYEGYCSFCFTSALSTESASHVSTCMPALVLSASVKHKAQPSSPQGKTHQGGPCLPSACVHWTKWKCRKVIFCGQ